MTRTSFKLPAWSVLFLVLGIAATTACGDEEFNLTKEINFTATPNAAPLGNGRFVVVLVEQLPWVEDFRIFGRLVNANSSRTGGELGALFPIGKGHNPSVSTPSFSSAVVGPEAPHFVVTWSDADGILARVYRGDGSPRASEFRVVSLPPDPWEPIFTPFVAMLSEDAFVVTWKTNPLPQGGLQEYISAQLFDLDGNPLLPNPINVDEFFLINKQVFHPVVERLRDGDFIVSWSIRIPGNSHMAQEVRAQIFQSNGQPRGSTLWVNSYHYYDQRFPDVAPLTDGGFVIVWESIAPQDGSGSGIFGQRFDRERKPVGGEFQVNESSQGNQTEPHVIGTPSGGFIVAWRGPNPSGTGPSSAVFQRQFNCNGRPGPEFRVNLTLEGSHHNPAMAYIQAKWSRDYVTVWDFEQNPTEPEASSNILGRYIFDSGLCPL